MQTIFRFLVPAQQTWVSQYSVTPPVEFSCMFLVCLRVRSLRTFTKAPPTDYDKIIRQFLGCFQLISEHAYSFHRTTKCFDLIFSKCHKICSTMFSLLYSSSSFTVADCISGVSEFYHRSFTVLRRCLLLYLILIVITLRLRRLRRDLFALL